MAHYIENNREKLGGRVRAVAGQVNRTKPAPKFSPALGSGRRATKVARTAGVSVLQVQEPIEKVKDIIAEVRDIEFHIIPDKVIIQGTLHKQIFFVDAEGVVRHQEENIPFSLFVEIEGAEPGMNAIVEPEVEHVAFRLNEERTRILQKVVLAFFVKVTEFEQVEVELNEEGPLFLVQQVVNEGTTQVALNNTITLPTPAEKVSEIVANIQEIITQVIEDKVIIQGTVDKQIFFVDEAGVQRHLAEELEFSTFVDIEGAEPGDNVQVHPEVEDIHFELVDPTTLEQTVVIGLFVKVTENAQLNLEIAEEGQLYLLEEVVGEAEEQIMRVETITLPVSAEKITQFTATVEDLTTEVIEGKVIIQGVLEQQIFFIEEETDTERHIAIETPFSALVEVEGAKPGMRAFVEAEVAAQLPQLIDPTTLRVKKIVDLFVKVLQADQLPVVTGEGPLLKLPRVVGEDTEQILIEREVEIVPEPVLPEAIPAVLKLAEPEEEVTEQILVDTRVDLPEPAIKVRDIEAEAVVTDVEVQEDAVIVQGVVEKTITFVGEDDIVEEFEETVPFDALVDVPGIMPGDLVEVSVVVEDVIFELEDEGRVVRQKVVLEITVATNGEFQQVQVITDVVGEGIEVLERVLVRELVVIGEQTITPTLEDELVFDPPFAELIALEAVIEDLTAVPGTDQVTVTGTVVKTITYEDTAGEEQQLMVTIPFEETVTIVGTTPEDEVQVSAEITEVTLDVAEGGETGTETVTLEIFVKVARLSEIFVVTEVAGPAIEDVTKQVLDLFVVEAGEVQPVEVVTSVEFVPQA